MVLLEDDPFEQELAANDNSSMVETERDRLIRLVRHISCTQGAVATITLSVGTSCKAWYCESWQLPLASVTQSGHDGWCLIKRDDQWLAWQSLRESCLAAWTLPP